MKQLVLLMLSLALLGAISCTDDDCSCPSGPYYANLKVKLTINEENPEVLLTIFEGNFESGDTLISEVIDEDKVFYEMEAGRYYSAVVVYVDGAREITAIDGRKMRTSEDDCGCEYGENMTLNLRLVSW